MKIILKRTVANSKVSVPNKTEGFVKGTTNSTAIRDFYGAENVDDWFYLVEFKDFGTVLCPMRYCELL